jgi:hypothetical protein
MSRYKQEQFDRLPKWAQQEIQCLTRDLRYVSAQLVKTHAGDTDVFIRDGLDLKPLPPGSDIIFKRGGIEFGVRLRDDNALDVRSHRDCVAVRPQASNSIYVEQVG